MARYVRLLAIASILLAPTAHADPFSNWTRVAKVTDVEITEVMVSADELAEIRSAYGVTNQRSHGAAFSVLVRRGDTYHCTIYLAKDNYPTRAHELKHCRGWSH